MFKTKKTDRKVVLLDSSGIIDHRLHSLCKSGFISWKIIVPNYVLIEIQSLADKGNTMKRQRARKGLELLKEIREMKDIEFEVLDIDRRGDTEVDHQLMEDADRMSVSLYTTDFNLAKIAEVKGVEILNVNDLILALRPQFMAGETTKMKVMQRGSERGQGVGFLDDGTMVVISGASKYLGKTIEIVFDNTLQTDSGRILFAKAVAGANSAKKVRTDKSTEKDKAAKSKPATETHEADSAPKAASGSTSAGKQRQQTSNKRNTSKLMNKNSKQPKEQTQSNGGGGSSEKQPKQSAGQQRKSGPKRAASSRRNSNQKGQQRRYKTKDQLEDQLMNTIDKHIT